MSDLVRNDPDRSRYLLMRGDRELGKSLYVRGGDTIRFTHTVIDPELEERGLGSQLVRGALDDVRATTSARVIADCPFVARFIAKHEEYQDLTTR
ncbi:GNAT family N-acetyltransferase [uncultured Schumannella sp.]|uniref:GNAT family N-acetyltransferase n=1 Tax=uncultured Schumannella sp. TaxID=1195956 RepID=UPI0025E9331C|nr:GNAT family N-acetyltransferase [uncultured Schumannella sp.]